MVGWGVIGEVRCGGANGENFVTWCGGKVVLK